MWEGCGREGLGRLCQKLGRSVTDDFSPERVEKLELMEMLEFTTTCHHDCRVGAYGQAQKVIASGH